MKEYYVDGKVFTSARGALYAEAFAVEDGRFTEVGTAQELLRQAAAETEAGKEVRVHDLNGRTVIPGLIDAHMHPSMLADYSKRISALPPAVRSIEDLIGAIQAKRAEQGADEWITGWGFDEGKLAEHRPPTRWDLDRGAADVPVEIYRVCGHIAYVNSKALELAGITRETPDPVGGTIGRDENGEPNGILYETADHLIEPVRPLVSFEESVANMVDLGRLLSSQGIVAVTDMGDDSGSRIVQIYREAEKRGLAQDVAVYLTWVRVRREEGFHITADERDRAAKIRVAGLKLIGDGSYSGHTASVDVPYLGTDDYGIDVCTDEDITSAIQFAKENGIQVSTHAMGERAISRMLGFLKDEPNWIPQAAGKRSTQENDVLPHARLEHVTEPSEASQKLAAELGVPFATQPDFFFAEIESYLMNLGPERTRETYPLRTELARGVKVALSTDAPATSWAVPSDPFINMQAAVTRRAWDGTDCGAQEAIDIETAVQLYTREAAVISDLPDLGVIRPGARAAFVVLDRDLFTVAPAEIGSVKPEATYIDGKKVFSATGPSETE
ncbi:MAG: amidohydrolase [Clostridia bacterium]|nr:amidohydrolase [Clostridia bacterium]